MRSLLNPPPGESTGENTAGDNPLWGLTRKRTRRPGAVSRMATEALVGVTFPYQAPLIKGDAVWANRINGLTSSSASQSRPAQKT